MSKVIGLVFPAKGKKQGGGRPPEDKKPEESKTAEDKKPED